MSRELPDFRGRAVAVAGDVICDRYLVCEPKSLSREAPVMVLRHVAERIRAGGAGNVARNLCALGASTRLFGVVGRDAFGRELREELQRNGVDVEHLLSAPGWTTPLKSRIVAAEPRRNVQQVLRIDSEPLAPADPALRKDVRARLAGVIDAVDALVVSDYDYGFAEKDLGALAREFAARGKVVVFDPRERLEDFQGLTAITPNVAELAHFAHVAPERLSDFAELRAVALSVRERVQARWILVTRGNHGMALFGEGLPDAGVAVAASGSGNVTDVTGAGDTAAAVFALALAVGADATSAMVFANAAAGVVVMESGAAVCTSEALRAALTEAPAAGSPAGSTRA